MFDVSLVVSWFHGIGESGWLCKLLDVQAVAIQTKHQPYARIF
jgi:hypothetical protein